MIYLQLSDEPNPTLGSEQVTNTSTPVVLTGRKFNELNAVQQRDYVKYFAPRPKNIEEVSPDQIETAISYKYL